MPSVTHNKRPARGCHRAQGRAPIPYRWNSKLWRRSAYHDSIRSIRGDEVGAEHAPKVTEAALRMRYVCMLVEELFNTDGSVQAETPTAMRRLGPCCSARCPSQ